MLARMKYMIRGNVDSSLFAHGLWRHRNLISGSVAVCLVFTAMDVGKSLFFGNDSAPIWYLLFYALYLYLPWILFSLICGFVAQQTLSYKPNDRVFMFVTLPVGILITLLHISILTSSYWFFWPAAVTRVSFNFVFVEQLLKWGHFELLAYFGLLFVWRRQLQQQTASTSIRALQSTSTIRINSDKGVVSLAVNEIDFLLADDNYVVIYAGMLDFRVRTTLKELIKKLDSGCFVQTHRSAVVNLDHVRQVLASRVIMNSGAKVPLSRRRHKYLLEELDRNSTSSASSICR